MSRRLPSREWARRRREVLDRDGWRCQKCGKAGRLEVDHKTPLYRGGSNDLDNLQALCRRCHLDKTRHDYRGGPLPGEEEWASLIARWSDTDP